MTTVKATSIIGLTGFAGAGKSTAAVALHVLGYKWTSFSTPLKSMIETLLASQHVQNTHIHEMLRGSLKETPTPYLGGVTPRHAMQTLGTEWRDLISRDLWTTIWRNSIQCYDKVVVDDVRFNHEVEAIRALGGKIIKIQRPNQDGPSKGSHLSETEQAAIVADAVLWNDGTVDDLQRRIRSLVQSWEYHPLKLVHLR